MLGKRQGKTGWTCEEASRKTKDNSLESLEHKSVIKDEDQTSEREVTGNHLNAELSSSDRHSTQASETNACLWRKEIKKADFETNDYGSRSFRFRWKDNVEVTLDENIKVKIVDFGNACWTYKHFTDNI